MLSVFDQLLHAETFTDVTLAVDGQYLKAHKVSTGKFRRLEDQSFVLRKGVDIPIFSSDGDRRLLVSEDMFSKSATTTQSSPGGLSGWEQQI